MPRPTRRKPKPRNRPKGEEAAARDRASKALDLRIAGASYRQIGAQLQVSEKTAYYDVQTELGALDAVTADKAERLRDLEARRLDSLQVALTPGIRAGNPQAVAAAVRLMDRRARLFGLDTPVVQKIELKDTTAAARVARLQAARRRVAADGGDS